MKWKPIETCPQNTPVLVVASGVVQVFICELCDDEWLLSCDELYPLTNDWEFIPTHWMPLPTWNTRGLKNDN